MNETLSRSESADKTSLKAIALRASVVFHFALIVLLAFWYLPTSKPQRAGGELESPKVVQQTAVAPTAAPLATPMQATFTPTPNVPAEQIKSSLESQIEATASRPDDLKKQDLTQSLERLQRVVKPESVDDLVGSVARSMDIDPTMYADKAPVEGTRFNPNTAQLKSVERKVAESGRWTYEALMVDANGNRSIVPLTEAEGAMAYETFEKMKSMPMAGAFYQQLVMPLLQQMVAPENSRPAGNVVIVPEPEKLPIPNPN